MREMLEFIVRALVDHPEAIHITEVDGDRTVVFELRCEKGDLGKVIGKSGKTVGAIRTLLGSLAARQGKRALLEVVE